jgi:hypothetical protein
MGRPLVPIKIVEMTEGALCTFWLGRACHARAHAKHTRILHAHPLSLFSACPTGADWRATSPPVYQSTPLNGAASGQATHASKTFWLFGFLAGLAFPHLCLLPVAPLCRGAVSAPLLQSWPFVPLPLSGLLFSPLFPLVLLSFLPQGPHDPRPGFVSIFSVEERLERARLPFLFFFFFFSSLVPSAVASAHRQSTKGGGSQQKQVPARTSPVLRPEDYGARSIDQPNWRTKKKKKKRKKIKKKTIVELAQTWATHCTHTDETSCLAFRHVAILFSC